jgi:hypothetical protein
MAVQIINPVDTGVPMNPLTVEADTETEEEFTWVSLLCCSYGHYYTDAGTDWEEDIDA